MLIHNWRRNPLKSGRYFNFIGQLNLQESWCRNPLKSGRYFNAVLFYILLTADLSRNPLKSGRYFNNEKGVYNDYDIEFVAIPLNRVGISMLILSLKKLRTYMSQSP